MDDYSQQTDNNGGSSQVLPASNGMSGLDPAQNSVQSGGFDFDSQISSLPSEANDLDLIEKEWVTHLKQITARTSSNPFHMQHEISLAKADYLMKRYGKEVKSSET